MSRARTLTVVVLALLLGALFNAQALSDSAHRRVPGWERDVAIDLTDPLLEVSSALRLDRPAAWIEDVRDDDGVVADPSDGPPPLFDPDPENRVRLWVTGDSLMETVGPAVVNRSADTGVIDPSFDVVFSSGLTRPDFFNWPDHLARVLSEDPAEIVVFMVGANDGQPILTAGGWVAPDTIVWQDEYRLRVAETMDVLEERATTSIWVGQPISRSEPHSTEIALMNSIFEEEAEQRPSVHYVDSWELFVDVDGGYSAYLPDADGRPELVREDDGVHLTAAGANRLAQVILVEIATEWELGP